MSKLIVAGRQKLSGAAEVQGAKNSALPVLAATLLAKGENIIYNCPILSDVEASSHVLRYLGCTVNRSSHTLAVKSAGACRSDIPDELMRKTRSSIVFLGALLASTGSARMTLPGGCEIGQRPIDMHLRGLRALGRAVRTQRSANSFVVPQRGRDRGHNDCRGNRKRHNNNNKRGEGA